MFMCVSRPKPVLWIASVRWLDLTSAGGAAPQTVKHCFDQSAEKSRASEDLT